MFRTSTLLLFLPLLWIWINQPVAQQQKGSEPQNCGYPNYCARYDQRIAPYPATPPRWGSAGTVINDPVFGSRIMRVTDANSDFRKPGTSFQTPSSAQQNVWSTDSTKFYVKEAGGRFLVYSFDPVKMTEKLIDEPDVAWNGEPQFSYSQPNLLYGVNHATAEIQQYDVTSHKVATVSKPGDCVSLKSGDMAFDISASADDQIFMVAIGPGQDINYLLFVYDREKGCRWLNTMTGEIGGQWGPKGTLADVVHFGIHDARISKSGEYVAIAGSHEGPVIWQVNTLNVVLCSGKVPVSCGGHHALGYSHMVNPSRRHHPMELLVRPLNDVTQVTVLTSNLPETEGWYDKHFSWNNVDRGDTNPVCFSAYRSDNPSTPGAPLTVKGPWENEIDCLEMDGKGSKIWRFAHTYSTAGGGFWTTPRGNVSQDGRFYMFTSDWENELGQGRDGRFRHDAFVVELK